MRVRRERRLPWPNRGHAAVDVRTPGETEVSIDHSDEVGWPAIAGRIRPTPSGRDRRIEIFPLRYDPSEKLIEPTVRLRASWVRIEDLTATELDEWERTGQKPARLGRAV